MATKKDFKKNLAVQKFFSQEEESSGTQETHVAQFVHDAQETHVAQLVHDAQETHVAQSVHDAQEKHNVQAAPKRKKHIRINMAFYGDNHQYLEYISRISGISITQYVNNLIDIDKKVNQDKIERAKEILK